MSEQIGYQFSIDDRKFLESLNKFEHGLEDVRTEAKKLSTDTGKAFTQISQQISQAEKQSFGFKKLISGLISVDLIRQGANQMRNLGLQTINTASNYEQLNVAFSTFLGDSEKASKLLEELTQLAARTPFQQDEIFQASRQLLAFNIQAERIPDLLTDIGDISSGIGQPLNRLVLIFGQIQAKGNLAGQELLQLREAGVNPIEELAQVTGRAAHEIEGLVSKGEITADHVAAAFKLMTSEGGRFNNLMEKQADTFEGVTSNFRDQMSIIARDFGTELLPTLKEATKDAISFLKSLDPEDIKRFAQGLVSVVRTIASVVKELALITAGYVVGTIAQKAYAAGTAILTRGVKSLSAAIKLNPIGLIASAIALAIPALITLTKRLSGVTKAAEEMESVTRDLKAQFATETLEIKKHIDVLRSLNATNKERKAAIDALRQIHPDIIAKYDLEKGALSDLIALETELKNAIIDRIAQQAKQDITADFFQQLQDINSTDFSNKIVTRGINLFDVGRATEAEAEELKRREIAQAQDVYDEKIRIAKKSEADLRRIAGETTAAATESDQEALNRATKLSTQLESDLNKLSTAQLREIAKANVELKRSIAGGIDNDARNEDELRKRIATEIVSARESEARANVKNTDELEKGRKALEDYQETLKRIAEEIKKAGIDQIQDPIARLAAERDLNLEITTKQFAELRREATKLGQDLTTLEKLEAQARTQINVDYYRNLEELRKENREKALADFIASQENQPAVRRVASDGVNTSEELTRAAQLADLIDDLQKRRNRARELNSSELQSIENELNAALDDIAQVHLQNKQAVLDREAELERSQVERITKSADETITLEEYKEKKLLEIDLRKAKRSLELLEAAKLGNSVEANQLRESIATIEAQLAGFANSDLFSSLREQIKSIFKIDDAELDIAVQAIASSFGTIRDLISESTQFQIDQNQIILDSLRERISETEDALEKEQEDQKKGYASNVASKQAELAELKAQEQQHRDEQLRLQKAALKQQLVADALSQISSAATTVFNITKANSPYPAPVAIPLIAATIVSIFAMIKKFKQESKSLASQAFFKGGRIPKEGYTDKQGGRGHRIQDTNLIVGAGEHIINADASEEHDRFLQNLNAGRYSGMDLVKILKQVREARGLGQETPSLAERHRKNPHRPISKQIYDEIKDKNVQLIEAQGRSDARMRKEAFKEVMREHADRIIQAIENKTEYLPWMEGMKGIIEKKKNHTKRKPFRNR